MKEDYQLAELKIGHKGEEQMGTSSFVDLVRKAKFLSMLSLLGVLLVFQVWLPSDAFALPARADDYTFGQSRSLDKASVAVVRLVVTYTAANQTVQCTGLGVLVSSMANTGTSATVTNWVLTDGALINTVGATCLPASPSTQFSGVLTSPTVSIYTSTAYTPDVASSPPLPLGTVTLTSDTVRCDQRPCSNGAALFAFQTSRLQPFLALSTAVNAHPFGIELTDGASTVPAQTNTDPRSPSPTVYLTPFLLSVPAAGTPSTGTTPVLRREPGMPLVDSNGDLQGIQLMNGTVPSDIIALGNFVNLHVQASPGASGSNLLQTNWDTGIADYYAVPPKYSAAQKAFQQAAGVNPDFKAATVFANLAAQKVASSSKSANVGSRQVPTSRALFGISLSLITLFEIVVGFIVLGTLFVFMSLHFGRARAKRKAIIAQFRVDAEEAQRRAELEVQQRKQQEQQRINLVENKTPIADTQPVPDLQLPKPTIPPKPKETQVSLASLGQQASVNNESSVAQPKSSPDTSCPNCGHAVPPGAVFCPNCRYQLLPAVASPRSQLRTLPVLEISDDKAMTSSIASQAPQEKETKLDDVVVQAALQRLWDRAGR